MTDSAKLSKPADDSMGRAGSFSLDVERRTVSSALRDYLNRVRSGDPGALPSVLGLAFLAIIFSQASDKFLTRGNIGNLPGQGAFIAVIALGLVFVLLLGEIDLSAGTAGGVCAAFAAQGIFSGGLRDGVPGLLYWLLVVAMVAAIGLGLYLKTYIGPAIVLVGVLITLTGLDEHVVPALVFAIGIGAAIGIVVGWLSAKVGIPSFIVTLALFLAFQGVQLFALKSQSISVTGYSFWNGLANFNMSPFWSWLFVLALVGGYIAYTVIRAVRSQAKGLSADAISLVLIRAGLIALVAVVVVVLANQDRNPNEGFPIEGLPWAATIPIALMVGCAIVLTKTTWGRHLFAIGGNAEAARRAGIDVVRVKVGAFTACSAFGALGGIFLASNSGGALLGLGSGNVLLFSVAAAVIGGTSLFGGRGKARDAIIGGLVIVIIPNGIGLRPSLPPEYNNVITGAVLLLAASVDAISRRRAKAG